MEPNVLRIGELAELTGCAVETIRYYEQAGLLPGPRRSAGNYRLYAAGHVERLAFIRRCRSLDMTHEEIRALLAVRDAPEGDCAGANELLDEHIGHVARRVTELQSLERDLRALRRLCRRASKARECGILRQLSTAAPETPRSGASGDHVHGSHGKGGRARVAKGR